MRRFEGAPLSGVSDLYGIEHCVNLTKLVLGDACPVTSFRALALIPALEMLSCTGARVDTLATLEGAALTYLHLVNAPLVDLNGVDTMPALETLYISGGRLSDTAALSGATALRDVQITASEVSTLPDLDGLTALETLVLNRNDIADVQGLSGLTSLTRLSLRANLVAGIAPICQIGQLRELDISQNPVASLAGIGSLDALTILRANAIATPDFSPVGGCAHLKQLHAEGNGITTLTGFETLGSIRLLQLDNNSIQDVTPLVNNPGLATNDAVHLLGNPLTNAAVCDIESKLVPRGVTVYKHGECDSFSLTAIAPALHRSRAVPANLVGSNVEAVVDAWERSGWRFVEWRWVTGPEKGLQESTDPNALVSYPAVEPYDRTIEAVYELDWAALNLRADLDTLYADALYTHARWYTLDFQGGNFPDGFEFYLLEKFLKDDAAGIDPTDIAAVRAAYQDNWDLLDRTLYPDNKRAYVNALAAFHTIGNDYFRFFETDIRLFVAWMASLAVGGLHYYPRESEFSAVPNLLSENANPDDDSFTNAEEYEFARLYNEDSNARAEVYVDAAISELSPHGDFIHTRHDILTAFVSIAIEGEGAVNIGEGTFEMAIYPYQPNSCNGLCPAEFVHCGPCVPRELNLEATPAAGWIFRRWEGMAFDTTSPQTAAFLAEELSIRAIFEERPGMLDMDFQSDLAKFLVAVEELEEEVLISDLSIDYGGVESHIDGTRECVGNGIPDAAELALLQAVLQDTSLGRNQPNGTNHNIIWKDWEDNLDQARNDLPEATPGVQRAIAGYMTLGYYDIRRFVLDRVSTTYGVFLDPTEYVNLSGQHFAPDRDADMDGASNAEEWELVENNPDISLDHRVQAYIDHALDSSSLPPEYTGGAKNVIVDTAPWNSDCVPDVPIRFRHTEDTPLIIEPETGERHILNNPSDGPLELSMPLGSHVCLATSAPLPTLFSAWHTKDEEPLDISGSTHLVDFVTHTRRGATISPRYDDLSTMHIHSGLVRVAAQNEHVQIIYDNDDVWVMGPTGAIVCISHPHNTYKLYNEEDDVYKVVRLYPMGYITDGVLNKEASYTKSPEGARVPLGRAEHLYPQWSAFPLGDELRDRAPTSRVTASGEGYARLCAETEGGGNNPTPFVETVEGRNVGVVGVPEDGHYLYASNITEGDPVTGTLDFKRKGELRLMVKAVDGCTGPQWSVGYITQNPGGREFEGPTKLLGSDKGTAVVLSAHPQPGYEFAYWEGAGEDAHGNDLEGYEQSVMEITMDNGHGMPADREVTAVFQCLNAWQEGHVQFEAPFSIVWGKVGGLADRLPSWLGQLKANAKERLESELKQNTTLFHRFCCSATNAQSNWGYKKAEFLLQNSFTVGPYPLTPGSLTGEAWAPEIGQSIHMSGELGLVGDITIGPRVGFDYIWEDGSCIAPALCTGFDNFAFGIDADLEARLSIQGDVSVSGRTDDGRRDGGTIETGGGAATGITASIGGEIRLESDPSMDCVADLCFYMNWPTVEWFVRANIFGGTVEYTATLYRGAQGDDLGCIDY